ncbi:hypothetical protein KEM48_006113 [Puccinia striiformis f. sp. tritici PST-130]|uniref:Uncharacterized protein n=1 Tax=Puccinia striiformis f. sp. tritici PST-78 TaxID=1165861 RepID=A0A0L0VXU8_9BASI|nr:hypothetical protein H4Q26_006129 [Puccinia striiformis f. sp. tritici PST-130]KAI9614135.1 hypothetical protein KEM48_006113 [Puccinia striiformis f. sp. tritici PST-130]KNF04086.1 hypothetical protein PSTG_02791 [Puccinia striiformis f. sp. tritici PST-78]
MNHRHMSQLFHSRIKRSRLLTQSRHTVKNLEGYGVIINKPACKEFLVNVDQEDYEKGVDVEPVNLKFPLQFSSSLDKLNVIAMVCSPATSKTLQYPSPTSNQRA